MIIEIKISEEDYKNICSEVMTIEELYCTTKGKLYGSVVRAYKEKEHINSSTAKQDVR